MVYIRTYVQYVGTSHSLNCTTNLIQVEVMPKSMYVWYTSVNNDFTNINMQLAASIHMHTGRTQNCFSKWCIHRFNKTMKEIPTIQDKTTINSNKRLVHKYKDIQ